MNVEEILEAAGVKPTSNRILLMREIIACEHCFSLGDLEISMAPMDRSTIFRTLTTFLEHGLIHEVDNGASAMLYCRCSCNNGHDHQHIHFTCSHCGETYCIRNIDTAALPRPQGFLVEEVNCVMKGLCPKCLARTRTVAED